MSTSIISVDNLEKRVKQFHDQNLTVYPTSLRFEDIHFWPQNNRTLFTFERLEAETGKKLEALSLEQITDFVAKEPLHELPKLAKSINNSGVQIPLIVSDRGKLLDGNRRYFACAYLKFQAEKKRQPIPKALEAIPVLVIKHEDLANPLTELKIIAEANFVADLKVVWPLDAQARAIEEYSSRFKKNDGTSYEPHELAEMLGIDRARVVDLLDTLALTKEYIDQAANGEEIIRKHRIVENKFVYFWEFVNKGIKGRSGFEGKPELPEVKQMFFDLIDTGRDSNLTNVKQVEPIVQARRDDVAWSLLNESSSNLAIVVAMINEKKEIRKAEDKLRLFHAWLEKASEFTPAAKNYLIKISELARSKAE